MGMEQDSSAVEEPEEQSINSEIQEDSEGGNTIISCDSVMDISGVEALFHRLEDALDIGQSVEIHAQDVERVDTAIVQIFVAFVKEAERMQLEVIWKGVSEGMLSTIRSLGVLKFLNVPESAYL